MTKWFICSRDNLEDASGFDNRDDAIEEAKRWLSYDPEMTVMLFSAEQAANIYVPDPDPVIDFLE